MNSDLVKCFNGLQAKIDSLCGCVGTQQSQINNLTSENRDLKEEVKAINTLLQDRLPLEGSQGTVSPSTSHKNLAPKVNDTPGSGSPDADTSSSSDESLGLFTTPNQRAHDPNRKKVKPQVIMLSDSLAKHIDNDQFLGQTRSEIRRTSTINSAQNAVSKWLTCRDTTCMVLHVGINDLNNGQSPDQVTKDTVTLIETCTSKYPNAKIVYSSILHKTPMDTSDNLVNKITKVNNNIEQHCNRNPNLNFITHHIPDIHFTDKLHVNDASGTRLFVSQLTHAIRVLSRRNRQSSHEAGYSTNQFTQPQHNQHQKEQQQSNYQGNPQHTRSYDQLRQSQSHSYHTQSHSQHQRNQHQGNHLGGAYRDPPCQPNTGYTRPFQYDPRPNYYTNHSQDNVNQRGHSNRSSNNNPSGERASNYGRNSRSLGSRLKDALNMLRTG